MLPDHGLVGYYRRDWSILRIHCICGQYRGAALRVSVPVRYLPPRMIARVGRERGNGGKLADSISSVSPHGARVSTGSHVLASYPTDHAA